MREYARINKVQPGQLRRWLKALPTLQAASTRRRTSVNSNRVTAHKGKKSSLQPLKDELLQWLFELRQDAMTVSTRLLVLHACKLDSTFRRKNEQTRYGIARRFLLANGLVIQTTTHQAQAHPQDKLDEAASFMESIRPLVANTDQRYVINMDQTPTYFSMTPKTTLAPRGSRTVNARTSTSSTVRVTVAVTVTAAGDTLPFLLVFKGETGKTVQKRMQRDGDERLLYYAQPKA